MKTQTSLPLFDPFAPVMAAPVTAADLREAEAGMAEMKITAWLEGVGYGTLLRWRDSDPFPPSGLVLAIRTDYQTLVRTQGKADADAELLQWIRDALATKDCRARAEFEADPRACLDCKRLGVPCATCETEELFSSIGATLQEGGSVDWAQVHAAAAERRAA